MTELLAYIQEFISAEVRFHPIYLFPFFGIALLLYIFQEKEKIGFFKWLFPKKIYFHPSHYTDLKLFVLGRILTVTRLFNIVFIQTAFAVVGMGVVGMVTDLEMSVQELTLMRGILATLIITITADFCIYWVHRFHHETPIFWPFHAVHHSAEIMTPVTVYRKHPIYDLIADFTKAVLIGFIQGMILMLLLGQVQLSLIAGINIFYFAFNFLGSNFRHSHIWFSYGRVLEHIFISPAQHQIHHSLEPKHHNKNYGEVLATWDWMFGTLYVPKDREEISYGISKSAKSNERVEQPHPTLTKALVVPFQDSWKAIRRRSRKENKT